MLAELSELPAPTALPSALPTPRAARADDTAALAALASEAFRDTVDDRSLKEYHDDIQATLAGRFGPFLADASAVVATPTKTLAAVLFAFEHELPFMPYCLTDPTVQRRGLATHLVTRAAALLLRDGHRQLHLAVLETSPAKVLYAHLGFRKAPLP